jgi:hypothetical protein
LVARPGRPPTGRGSTLSTFLWIALATLYLVLLFTLAMTTWRNGHRVLFFAGIVLPFFWIIGALISPTPAAATAGAASAQ